MIDLEPATAVDPPRASRVPPAAPSANGELRDRVQKLRLGAGGAKGSRGGGVAWLPWLLCLALALTWAGMTYPFTTNWELPAATPFVSRSTSRRPSRGSVTTIVSTGRRRGLLVAVAMGRSSL